MLKIPARLPVFLGTLNLVASPHKFFIVTFVCIYLKGFFLEKRKIGLLDIVEIENNKKRHLLKMPVLLRGQSILSRFLDGVLQVWPICKRIYSENFSFFLLFFLCFGL